MIFKHVKHHLSYAMNTNTLKIMDTNTSKTMNIPTFKIILEGPGGVGKTSYVKRLIGVDFNGCHMETLGVEVHPVLLYTNLGKVVLNIWDCGGMPKLGGLKNGYYVGANGAMVMDDLSNPRGLTSILDLIRNSCSNIPIVMCGNKNDIKDIPNKQDQILFNWATNNGIPYYSISSKFCDNLEGPLISLLKVLLSEDAQIVESFYHSSLSPNL